MGAVLDRRGFKQQRQAASQALFILENAKHCPPDADRINVGLELASALREHKGTAAELLSKLLDAAPKDVILERIDVLFDPAFGIDVLKCLSTAGRNRRLYILWPGQIEGSYITYAEPTSPDWHQYDITTHNAVYLIMK